MGFALMLAVAAIAAGTSAALVLAAADAQGGESRQQAL